MKPHSEDDLNYIQGFEDGCNFIVTEIERYIIRYDFEPRIANPLCNLLAHLKAKGSTHVTRENP